MHDRTSTIGDFLDAVAARQPAPASGSVTAIAGALAAAMGEMVLSYSFGKKGLEDHAEANRAILEELHRARELLLQLMVEDQAAYEAFSAVRKLPDDSLERAERFEPALLACIRIPQAMAAAAVSVLDRCDRLVDSVSYYMLCDLAVCADLAMATVRCALYNVRINLKDVSELQDKLSIEKNSGELLLHASRLIQRVSPRIWRRDARGE